MQIINFYQKNERTFKHKREASVNYVYSRLVHVLYLTLILNIYINFT